MTEQTLEDLCKLIVKRLKRDWDIVVAITGEEGIGKSSLAIRMGMMIDPEFDLERNIIYIPSYKQIVDKITHDLPRYSVVIVDEAIKTMYKRRFANRLQIFLNTIYSICRKENKASILCMPDFQDFDRFFRQHRILLWIHILERGKAVVFVRDWSPFTRDKWWMDENQKVLEKHVRRRKVGELDYADKIGALQDSRNFFFYFEFDPLPKKIEKRYKKLNAGYRLEMPTLQEPASVIKYRMALATAVSLIYNHLGMTQKEIANQLGFSRATIGTLLKEMDQRPIDKSIAK